MRGPTLTLRDTCAEGDGTVSLAKLPVGQRIKHYRRKNGNRTQAAIAGLCGITERYLQQIEAGQKMPSADVLARIAAEPKRRSLAAG